MYADRQHNPAFHRLGRGRAASATHTAWLAATRPERTPLLPLEGAQKYHKDGTAVVFGV